MYLEWRKLSVREYISELLEEGKIDREIFLETDVILKPTTVVERNDLFFIAQMENRLLYEPLSRFNLIYFPINLEHAEIFSKSEVKYGGPQVEYPGCVAVLSTWHYINERKINIDYLQYSFKQGSPPELTRSLAAKYMGARYHLLRSFFKMDLISCVDSFSIGGLEKINPKNLEALEKIISEDKSIERQFERKGDKFCRRKRLFFFSYPNKLMES